MACNNDQCYAIIIRLIMNPARTIINKVLSKGNTVYQSAVQNLKLKWEENGLVLFVPIANYTKNTIQLTIIPLELRRCVFKVFHINPLGRHFFQYYTLHQIQLRYHWPNMYIYFKQNIKDCIASCIL
jgi:hypothetical protein